MIPVDVVSYRWIIYHLTGKIWNATIQFVGEIWNYTVSDRFKPVNTPLKRSYGRTIGNTISLVMVAP